MAWARGIFRGCSPREVPPLILIRIQCAAKKITVLQCALQNKDGMGIKKILDETKMVCSPKLKTQLSVKANVYIISTHQTKHFYITLKSNVLHLICNSVWTYQEIEKHSFLYYQLQFYCVQHCSLKLCLFDKFKFSFFGSMDSCKPNVWLSFV